MRDSMILWDLASRYDLERISSDITLPVRARATYVWSVALGILGAIGILVLSVSLIVDSTSLAALRGAGFAVFGIFLGMGARLYLSVCSDASYRRFGTMGRWFNVASGWFFQSCAVIMDLAAIGILLLGWAESASHAKGAPGVFGLSLGFSVLAVAVAVMGRSARPSLIPLGRYSTSSTGIRISAVILWASVAVMVIAILAVASTLISQALIAVGFLFSVLTLIGAQFSREVRTMGTISERLTDALSSTYLAARAMRVAGPGDGRQADLQRTFLALESLATVAPSSRFWSIPQVRVAPAHLACLRAVAGYLCDLPMLDPPPARSTFILDQIGVEKSVKEFAGVLEDYLWQMRRRLLATGTTIRLEDRLAARGRLVSGPEGS